MYYSQEGKELLKLIVKKHNCSFTDAFQSLPEDIKEIFIGGWEMKLSTNIIMYFPYKSDRVDKIII